MSEQQAYYETKKLLIPDISEMTEKYHNHKNEFLNSVYVTLCNYIPLTASEGRDFYLSEEFKYIQHPDLLDANRSLLDKDIIDIKKTFTDAGYKIEHSLYRNEFVKFTIWGW